MLGPRLLLLHAVGLDGASWDRLTPLLEDGFQSVAVDLPGHGDNEKPGDADYGPWSLGRRMLALLDELEWPDATLIGNSLGGGVSLAAALQAPERVRSLALLNSVAYRDGLPLVGRLASFPLAAQFCRHVPLPAILLGLESARGRRGTVSRERCLACRRYLHSPDGCRAFIGAVRALYGPDLERMAAAYGVIHCPTLVLHGNRDRLLSVRHAKRLAAAIPGAEVALLPGCGHFPQEEAPAEVASHLLPFLAAHSGAPGSPCGVL